MFKRKNYRSVEEQPYSDSKDKNNRHTFAGK